MPKKLMPVITLHIYTTTYMKTYFNPSRKRFKKICKENGLPYQKTFRLMLGLPSSVHTVKIVVPTYLESQQQSDCLTPDEFLEKVRVKLGQHLEKKS